MRLCREFERKMVWMGRRAAHSVASPGGSYWTIQVTAGKSRPRAATSVQNRTPRVQREKSRNVCVLIVCNTLPQSQG